MHTILILLCGILSIFSLSASPLFAIEQEQTPSMLFMPLRAYIFEPRVGGFAETQGNSLRLDIGTSLDLFSLYNTAGRDFESMFGVDFFTYTRLRSEGRFKFPVETTDFFFGVYGAAVWREAVTIGGLPAADIAARVRIAHISSHLSDGYIPPGNIPIQEAAFVYSREFVETVVAIDWHVLRLYAGSSFLFSTIPSNFALLMPQIGGDFSVPLGSSLGLVGGVDARLTHISGSAAHYISAQAGIKFGELRGRGLSLNIYAFTGNSIHGLFYMDKDSYIAIGFQAEL